MSANYTVNIAAFNGFAGAVALSVSGLPSGATASFSPASVTGSGSATLNVTTTANTPIGISTLTVTGMTGALSHTTTITLTLTSPPPPDFVLLATPISRTVNPGAGTSYTLTVGAQNGFAGTVSFTSSESPPNISASFSGAVTGSGSATMSISTLGTAAVGTYPLTIAGTSGNLTHTTSVTLSVSNTPPGQGAVSINFVGNAPSGMGSSETAGVVGKANWNNATGAASASPLSLLDETRAGTGATGVMDFR